MTNTAHEELNIEGSRIIPANLLKLFLYGIWYKPLLMRLKGFGILEFTDRSTWLNKFPLPHNNKIILDKNTLEVSGWLFRLRFPWKSVSEFSLGKNGIIFFSPVTQINSEMKKGRERWVLNVFDIQTSDLVNVLNQWREYAHMEKAA